MTLDRTNELVGLIVTLVALLGVIVGWLRWVRPRWRHLSQRVGAALDTIAGREAILDPITGKELAPPLPSVGQRMDTLESTVTKLIEAEVNRAALDVRVTEAHQRIDANEVRLDALEAAAIERVATKAEAVSAWRAIEAVAREAGITAEPDDADEKEIP